MARGPDWRGAASLLAAWLAAASPAAAQSIQIPDFRQDALRTAPGPRPGERCDDCGVVRAVREIQRQRPVTVPKAFHNEPGDYGPGSTVRVGAVMALPIGESGDKPFVGGVGTPEMRQRFAETTYEIVVQLDGGGYTSVQRDNGAYFQVGDRVRVRGIQIELIAP